jgi:hypothetical protein
MDDNYDSEDDDTDNEHDNQEMDDHADIPILPTDIPIAGVHSADENNDQHDQHENLQNSEMLHEHHDNNEIENEHDNQEMDDHENLQELPMTVEEEMDAKYGTHTNAYQLRPRKPRDYGHLHATLEHTAMTQYNMKKA